MYYWHENCLENECKNAISFIMHQTKDIIINESKYASIIRLKQIMSIELLAKTCASPQKFELTENEVFCKQWQSES